ncbi:diguanylate cyclase domain-containing protein [Oleidesulfovibrio sp.]|uniref:diguanylate cyclase domain-containing protein n=1 Tax=Oleidesulfovibrio sp. TaxID=2909707 RepID=UPI003A8B4640
MPLFQILAVSNVALLIWAVVKDYNKKPVSYKIFSVGIGFILLSGILGQFQHGVAGSELVFSYVLVVGILLGSVLITLSTFFLADEEVNMRFRTTVAHNLSNEYSRYEALISRTGDVFFDWNSETDCAYLSTNFEEFFGIPRRHDRFSEHFENYSTTLRMSGEIKTALSRISGESEHEHVEGSFIHPDGAERWFSLDLTTSLNHEGKKVHIIGIVRDITEQKKLQLQCAAQQEYNDISSRLYSNVLEADMSRNVLIGQNAAQLAAHLGLGKNLCYEDTIEAIQDQLTHPDYRQAYGEALSRKRILSLYKNAFTCFDHVTYELDGNGVYQWLRLDVQIYYSDITDAIRIISYVRNISNEKSRELALFESSQRDSLSNLLNKGATRVAIEQLLVSSPSATRHALFMIDVDNFKAVNDTLGHFAGDSVIVDVADKLRSLFRCEDILGRFGGDEFVVFMTDITDLASLEAKCRQLNDEVTLRYKSDEAECAIGLSIGVAVYPVHGQDYATLCTKADSALYAVKNDGKGTYAIYSDELLHV